jgi:two-component system phosphate regulon sensor histidine kinase PhoR
MSKGKFAGLIFMMLLSITGISWVQLVWIRSAIGIRNENFDYYARAGISDAAGSIESSRKSEFFNNFLFSGLDRTQDSSGVSSYLSMDSYSVENSTGGLSIRITNQSVTKVPGEDPKVFIRDTLITSDTAALILDKGPGSENLVIIDNPAAGKGSTSGIYVRQKEFVDWIKKRSDEFLNMSDQMISEVYQWEKTMELDNRELEFALRRALIYRGIETPFEFALIKNGELSGGVYKKSTPGDFLKSKYMIRMFPDNIIRQDLVLSVVFPEKANYVLGSMTGILGASFLFSLIILATFGMSLFFIIRQKKISEMKSDFINNMTHEFKTPIATISLAADTITNPKVIKDELSIRHFIGMIKKENSRMNKKVETILQIASLDNKEIDFSFGDVSMHTIIEKAVDTIDILLQQRNGKIRLELNAANPVIYGDSEHLYNLVNNLLDNAIKYSEGAPEIRISTTDREGGLLLSVEDKGIGMSKSVQSRIFERFYRQTSGNIHDVKGFGLGLNYVRAIVDAHKGNIIVHSEPGKGSRFDVYLPFNWES